MRPGRRDAARQQRSEQLPSSVHQIRVLAPPPVVNGGRVERETCSCSLLTVSLHGQRARRAKADLRLRAMHRLLVSLHLTSGPDRPDPVRLGTAGGVGARFTGRPRGRVPIELGEHCVGDVHPVRIECSAKSRRCRQFGGYDRIQCAVVRCFHCSQRTIKQPLRQSVGVACVRE